MAPDALHKALHPSPNQVTLNEIYSNGQIKQARFLYMTRGRKSSLSFQYLGHKGLKSSDAFSILLSHKENSKMKKNSENDNHFRRYCKLHNWLKCPGSSIKVVPVRLIKDLPAWFL